MPSPGAYRSPRIGALGVVQTRLANAHWLRGLLRRLTAPLPFPVLRSDVRDIVYANWLLPLATARGLLPPGVTPMTRGGMTLLTILTYRHGHFGPALAGPLRRLFPSPLQSNWRLYIAEIDGVPVARPTVFFLANIFDTALCAIGSRLMSDALPSHQAACFIHAQEGAGYRTSIEGGRGSAPALTLVTEPGHPIMPAAFANFFGADDALRAICLQDAAIVPFGDAGGLAQACIDLPIDVATAEALTVRAFAPGALLRRLGATAAPWCFRVPGARFAVLGENILVCPLPREDGPIRA